MEKQNLKEDILDKALEMFSEMGFKKTSINKIVQDLGVSKGAFYHYFESKDELIRELVNRYVDTVVSFPNEMINHPQLCAMEKLNRLIEAFVTYKTLNVEIRQKYRGLANKTDNYEIREMIYADIVEKATVPYVKIFEQGIDEGVFDMDYPKQTAQVWLMSVLSFNSTVSRAVENGQTIDDFEERLRFSENLLERLTGAKKGTVKYYEIYKTYLDELGGKLNDDSLE